MIEPIVIFILILLNGFFAMAEMAVVSARKVRLQQQAESGSKQAAMALELAQKPGRFLSTVQVGISLVAMLTGALGGATLAGPLAAKLAVIPRLAPYSEALGMGIVVIGITYLSLIVGELFPKQIAINNAETIAAFIARPLTWLSKALHPAVWVLSQSTKLLMFFFRVKRTKSTHITDEDVRMMVRQGIQRGVFDPIEEEMIRRMFLLSDQRAIDLITHRSEIVWLDVGQSTDEIVKIVLERGQSKYPVCDGDLDHILGVVSTRELLTGYIAGKTICLKKLLKPTADVPEGMPVFDVMNRMHANRNSIALVIDEYGAFQGIVTYADIMEAIVGDAPSDTGDKDRDVVQIREGAYLLDGMIPMDEFVDLFQIRMPIKREAWHCSTLGGLVMVMLKRIPVKGDAFDWGGLHFEVKRMQGRRVDKVQVETLPE